MTADVRFGASTHIGLVRERNDDSELHAPPMFAVADGMGGHAGGDVASAMAIEAISSEPADLERSIQEANAAIYERSLREAHLQGMGTTLTALRASDESVEIADVGDSRAYLFSGGTLAQVTQDHTEVGRLVRQGRISKQDAARHPRRNYIERALGIFPEVQIDSSTIPASSGDRFLLCSDGLFGMIDDDQIAQILDEEGDPQAAATRLCEAALEGGGTDNVTAVVVDYGARTPGRQPSATRLQTHVKKKSRLLRYALVAVVVMLAGGLVARASINNSWYVGANGGHVAIFNGVPSSLAGIELSKVATPTEIPIRDLPSNVQRHLQDGIRAVDLTEAQKTVASLKELAAIVPPTGTVGAP